MHTSKNRAKLNVSSRTDAARGVEGVDVGHRIRDIRKRLGISMTELAKKVGVSPVTMHRIETGKTSPSVALLAKIAYVLNYPLPSFFVNSSKRLVHVKADKQPSVSSRNLKLKLCAPKGLIDPDISITVGEAETGEFVSRHTNTGYELAYIIKGKCIFKYGNQEIELNEGDLIYFDARVPHSVVALERHKFFGIHFVKK